MATSRVRKVLIVTATTGTGHISVAESLRHAFQNHPDDSVKVAVIDLIRLNDSGWLGPVGMLYSPIIVRYPRMWGPIFNATNNNNFWRLFRKAVRRARVDGISRWLAAERPDAIVCVHPVGVQILAESLRKTRMSIPLTTVLTDLGNVHDAWVAPEVNMYATPTEETSHALIEKSVRPERIKLLGLPLDQRFSQSHKTGHQSRLKMGLRPDAFTVLVSGGGEGAGDILGTVTAIDRTELPVQMIVACGRNEALLQSIKRRSLRVPCHAVPFHQNMPELLGAADVVVGKAGALTIGETLLARRPIIIYRPLSGQEQGNARFVRRHRIGTITTDLNALVYTLREWIASPDHPAAMVNNGERWRKEWSLSASRTVNATLELLEEMEIGRC